MRRLLRVALLALVAGSFGLAAPACSGTDKPKQDKKSWKVEKSHKKKRRRRKKAVKAKAAPRKHAQHPHGHGAHPHGRHAHHHHPHPHPHLDGEDGHHHPY